MIIGTMAGMTGSMRMVVGMVLGGCGPTPGGTSGDSGREGTGTGDGTRPRPRSARAQPSQAGRLTTEGSTCEAGCS